MLFKAQMSKAPFENRHVKFEFVGQILKGTFKEGLVTIDVAKMIVSERLKYSNYEEVPLMINDIGLKGIEREARQFLSTEAGSKGILASAIVTRNVFGSHLANFFLKISVIRPNMPVRLFTNESEAIAWLKNYVTENDPK
jgi:hypothetical protein